MNPEKMQEFALMMKMLGLGGTGQAQGQGPDLSAVIGQLNAPSPGEARRYGWEGAQMPSYTGSPTNPFNSGFFGAKPGSPEFSGRTTPTVPWMAGQAPPMGNQNDGGAGAMAASMASPLASGLRAEPAQNSFVNSQSPLDKSFFNSDPALSPTLDPAAMLMLNQQLAAPGAATRMRKPKSLSGGASANPKPGFSFGTRPR